MVTLCLKFCATPKLFSKAVHPFCILLWSEGLLSLKTHMLKSNYHRDGLGWADDPPLWMWLVTLLMKETAEN